jgi:hypothetical protein
MAIGDTPVGSLSKGLKRPPVHSADRLMFGRVHLHGVDMMGNEGHMTINNEERVYVY